MPAVFEPKVEVYIQCVNCGTQLGVIESQPGEDVRVPDHECAGPDQKLFDLFEVVEADWVPPGKIVAVPPMNIPPDGMVRWNIDRDGGPYGAG